MDANIERAQNEQSKGKKDGLFVNDKYFKPYTESRMVEAARQMLSDETISEEGFLGAQAVLLLNGLL